MSGLDESRRIIDRVQPVQRHGDVSQVVAGKAQRSQRKQKGLPPRGGRPVPFFPHSSTESIPSFQEECHTASSRNP